MKKYEQILKEMGVCEARDEDRKFSWKQIMKALEMNGVAPKGISTLLKSLNQLTKSAKGKIGFSKPKWDLFKRG